MTLPIIEIHNTNGLHVLQSLADKSVDVVFTSPPYNIGSKSDRMDGQRKHGKFDAKSYGGIQGYADNLPEDAYQEQQIAMLSEMARVIKPDGVVVYNHKPRRRGGEMIHPITWLSKVDGLTLMEEIVWDRGSTHNHSNKLFWPHTERLYVFRKTGGTYRLLNNGNLPQRSDVWKINLTARPALGHAAPFPTPLADAVLAAFARHGDLVCDPYSGSGTTAVAALHHGCDFIGAELDKEYWRASLGRVDAARAELSKSNIVEFKSIRKGGR